ncbi:MAG: DUF6691 family protein [Polyangiales bacterium]
MRWVRGIVSFAVGSVMAVSLVAGHITNPRTVQSFLDVFGTWSPALLFFMAGCVLPYFVVNRLSQRRSTPVLAGAFCVPSNTKIDTKLIAGSGIFGFGWGLVGVCPGPAFASLATGSVSVMGFVAAMAIGTLAYELLHARVAARARITRAVEIVGRASRRFGQGS